MRRFWIEIDDEKDKAPLFEGRSFGITALDAEDALGLLEHHVFKGGLPGIRKLVSDVDVSVLDQNHVVPNMGNVLIRGIWFPLGFTPQNRLSW
jgi:hypothetical protein